MSNTTISVTEAAEAARLADIRRQQEAERRVRIERERSTHMRGQILVQEKRLCRIQSGLDEAASRLPDLELPTAFSWPTSPGEKAEAAQLETYLNRISSQLDAYEQQTTNAIKQAEYRLQQRQATAAAWHNSQDAEVQWRLNNQAIGEMGLRLGQHQNSEAQPSRPTQDAELEVVEDYVARLLSSISRQQFALAALRAQALNLENAGKLAGTVVTGVRSGEQALAEFSADASATARSRFEDSVAQAMAAHAIRSEDLSTGLRRLLEGARQMATEKDWAIPLNDWMAREALRRRDSTRALSMLSAPPEGVLETMDLADRWRQLTSHLQAVMAGHEHMSSDIEEEFIQLERDAQRQLNYQLSRAACLARLAGEGMEVLDREDGQGLVVIDLSRPDTWLEVDEYEGEHGQFAATFVLKTNAAEGSFDEDAQTTSICQRLSKATTQNDEKISSESEIVERKSRITRARKPALKSRAMNF